jgi:hypothetical protein
MKNFMQATMIDFFCLNSLPPKSMQLKQNSIMQQGMPSYNKKYIYIREPQISVHQLVKCTLKYVRNFFPSYWIYKNCSK